MHRKGSTFRNCDSCTTCSTIRNDTIKYDKIAKANSSLFTFSRLAQILHYQPHSFGIIELRLLTLVASCKGIYQWRTALDPTVQPIHRHMRVTVWEVEQCQFRFWIINVTTQNYLLLVELNYSFVELNSSFVELNSSSVELSFRRLRFSEELHDEAYCLRREELRKSTLVAAGKGFD